MLNFNKRILSLSSLHPLFTLSSSFLIFPFALSILLSCNPKDEGRRVERRSRKRERKTRRKKTWLVIKLLWNICIAHKTVKSNHVSLLSKYSHIFTYIMFYEEYFINWKKFSKTREFFPNRVLHRPQNVSLFSHFQREEEKERKRKRVCLRTICIKSLLFVIWIGN